MRMLIVADKFSYWCSICHVRVQAWPLFDFGAHWNREGKGLFLEYRRKAELNEKGKGLWLDCGGKAESNEKGAEGLEMFTVPIDWEEDDEEEDSD